MRRLAVVAAAVALTLLVGVGVGNSAGTPQKIRMVGRDSFIRNALIQSTFRFSPYRQVVRHGATIRLKNRTGDPHTLTIVPRSRRPSNVDQVFNCKVCRKYPPKNNVGKHGINRVGDSRIIRPGSSRKVHITAPAGTKLYYVCAFHPWMQGTIEVR